MLQYIMNYTLKQLLVFARTELDLELFPEREEELVRIIRDIFEISRHEIHARQNEEIPTNPVHEFKSIILKRKTGIPLAYILGYSYFYHHKFPVSTDTLIPRYDTENLVEEVRKSYSKDTEFNILDVGTGTGAIALSLSFLFPNAIIKGVDIFDQPFKTSQEFLNISSSRVSVEKLDFLDVTLWNNLGQWDCIVSNPPYLDDYDMEILDSHVKNHEPHTALYADHGGMAFYIAIAEFTKNHLNKGGHVFLEVDHKYEQIIDIFKCTDMKNYRLVNDLCNLPRVLVFEF